MASVAVSQSKIPTKNPQLRLVGAKRPAADAPGMERPGTELIAHYLSPSRHPAGKGWSRKHADTQRQLCARYLEPVIGDLACEDIKAADMQAAVNAAPTAGEGDRVRR